VPDELGKIRRFKSGQAHSVAGGETWFSAGISRSDESGAVDIISPTVR